MMALGQVMLGKLSSIQTKIPRLKRQGIFLLYRDFFIQAHQLLQWERYFRKNV